MKAQPVVKEGKGNEKDERPNWISPL